jgi:hypothetical protein
MFCISQGFKDLDILVFIADIPTQYWKDKSKNRASESEGF